MTKTWAAARQNQQNDLYHRQRLRSAWASAQSESESSLCAHWVAKDRSFLHVDSGTAQSDLSLRWAHMSFSLFCRAVAHLPRGLFHHY